MLVIVKGLSKTLAERRSRGSIPIAHILWKDHNTENNHYSRIPRPLPTQRVMIPFPVSPFLVYSILFCFIFYLSCSLYPFHTVIWLSPKISVMHFPKFYCALESLSVFFFFVLFWFVLGFVLFFSRGGHFLILTSWDFFKLIILLITIKYLNGPWMNFGGKSVLQRAWRMYVILSSLNARMPVSKTLPCNLLCTCLT